MPSLSKEQVIDALRKVAAPQGRGDIVSLEMVRNVAACDGNVSVTVELPSPGDPASDTLRGHIEEAVRRLPDVSQVKVDFTARPPGLPQQGAVLPGVKNVIAVGAGKGGVGKSTVAVLLAWGLRRTGSSVGLMDADVYGPSIPKLTGLEGAQVELVPDPAGGDRQRWLPPEADGIRVMSPGFAIQPDQAAIMRGPMITNVFKQLFVDLTLWGDLDYLVVDLPPGTGDIPLTLAQIIPQTGAVAVVVATPQQVALLDALKALAMYRKLNVDVIGIVENMSYFVAPDTGKEYDLFGKGGAEVAAREVGVPLLGSLPINIAIRESGDAGSPMRIFEGRESALADAVNAMVESVAAEVAARNQSRAAPVKLSIDDD